MGCVSPGSLAAGGTNGDGQSGNAGDDSRVLVHLWPTGQPEVFEGLPGELGGIRLFYLTFDGGGTAPVAGTTADIFVPFAYTITQWTLLADVAGTAEIDIWKTSYASSPPTVSNSIVGTATPTLASTAKNQSTSLPGWTTAVAASDVLRANVTSSATLTRVTLILTAQTG